jgi:hypothetical protein
VANSNKKEANMGWQELGVITAMDEGLGYPKDNS